MEMVTKHQLLIFNQDKQLLYCKSFDSNLEARKYYINNLIAKYPKDKYFIRYSTYRTSV